MQFSGDTALVREVLLEGGAGRWYKLADSVDCWPSLFGFTLTLCMHPHSQESVAFGGSHKKHGCPHHGPTLAERMDELVTAITRQRKLLTMKRLLFKTESLWDQGGDDLSLICQVDGCAKLQDNARGSSSGRKTNI